MALGISVDGDALLGYEITVSDANVDDLIRVIRTDTTGHYEVVAVRGIDQITPTGATMLVTDYEAPINLDLTYTAQAFASSDLETPTSTATSGVVNTDLPVGFSIIIDVLDPASRVSGGIMELTSWSHPSRILATHQVLGRRNPVVISDVQSGRTGTIVANNINQFNVDFDGDGPYDLYEPIDGQWATIFSEGRTLLFRSDWRLSAFDDCYFHVNDLTVTRLSRVLGSDLIPIRQYSINFVEVDRPLTSQTSLSIDTWQTVLANNADWQEVLDDHDSWLDVLANPTA